MGAGAAVIGGGRGFGRVILAAFSAFSSIFRTERNRVSGKI